MLTKSYEPLLWEYGTESPTELRSGLCFSKICNCHNDTGMVYHRIPTERDQPAKLWSEGDIQRHVWYWHWVRSHFASGVSLMALTKHVHADAANPPGRKCHWLIASLCTVSVHLALYILQWGSLSNCSVSVQLLTSALVADQLHLPGQTERMSEYDSGGTRSLQTIRIVR